jgi:hypothetical protein
MSEQGVKKIMGRLVADDKFRKEFFANPQHAITESGYHLEVNEVTALSKLKASDLQVNFKRGGTVASVELDVRSARV